MSSMGDRALGTTHSFTVMHPSWMDYDASEVSYRYTVRSSLDVMTEGGRATIRFSGIDGTMLAFDPPLPANRTDAFTTWLYMLHFTQVFGLPYKVFISLVGSMVVLLSVTGTVIWMKKRAARETRAARRPRTSDWQSNFLR